REVRRLLNSLRRPELLADDSLAQMLCRVTGTQTAFEAVRVLSDVAFRGQGATGRRLATLVTLCDLEGRLSHSGVASEMGLSMRQFFRYRARAVQLLAHEIRRRLGGDVVLQPSLGALADVVKAIDPAAARELRTLDTGIGESDVTRADLEVRLGVLLPAGMPLTPNAERALGVLGKLMEGETETARTELALLKRDTEVQDDDTVQALIALVEAEDAQDRGDLRALQHCAERVRATFAHHNGAAHLAYRYELEALVKNGDIAQGREVLQHLWRIARDDRDSYALGLLTLVEARLSFIAGEYERAEDWAYAASLALQHHPTQSAECHIALNRARLLLGKPFQLPDDVVNRATFWQRLAFSALRARFALRNLDIAGALEQAECVLAAAAARQYRAVELYSFATLASCAGMCGDDEREEQLYLSAWRGLPQFPDHALAADLFLVPNARPRDIGPLAVSPAFLDSATDVLLAEAGATILRETVADALVDAIAFASEEEHGPPRAILTRGAVHSIASATDNLGRTIAALLLPRRRARWLQRWTARWQQIVSASQSVA
ncbi:MAG: hypothetical protein JO165_06065, partial [Candidatus Eremiobacteraeota bacterium]|nr:hypothetical protein [Candidatus Eremiobacteraeota bacterium]